VDFEKRLKLQTEGLLSPQLQSSEIKRLNDELAQKKEKIRKLKAKIEAIDLKTNSEENRKKASESEAIIFYEDGMTEEKKNCAIRITKDAFMMFDVQDDIAIYIAN
jgi:uncharacterized coiled-coil protein SlyX